MNLFTKQNQTHRLRKHMYDYQSRNMGGGGGINQEVGIKIYTLLYIKQIINKDLVYSTGNSTQYSVITDMGKDSDKEQAHVYV